MGRALAAFSAVLVIGLVAADYAWAQQADNTRRSMGNLRPDNPTAGRAVQGSSRFPSRRSVPVVVPYPLYGGYPYRPYFYGYRPSFYPYGNYPYYVRPYPYYFGGYRYGLPPYYGAYR